MIRLAIGMLSLSLVAVALGQATKETGRSGVGRTATASRPTRAS